MSTEVNEEMIVILCCCTFILLRVIHRFYYAWKGHKSYFFNEYSPRADLNQFLVENISVTEHSFRSKKDDVLIKYRRLGSGKKLVLLLNGVGTDFFMWLPILKCLITIKSNLFDDITIIVPSYRGLFGCNSINIADEVDITTLNCIDDIKQLMAHSKTLRFHTIMGWSLGAQTALTCCALHEDICERLFLLNPSTGQTLHTTLQAFYPLPTFIGKQCSYLIRNGVLLLKPLINTYIWVILKDFVESSHFYYILEISAFLGGYPPEQPPYFHEYMRDVFANRNHTIGLLDLILSLDTESPPEALALPIKTTIISGLPDIMTGVYHSITLAKQMQNSKHIMFSMGSHFLLLEWPDLVAREIIEIIQVI